VNSVDDEIQVTWKESPFLKDALVAAGFSARLNSDNYSYSFRPCPVGTFSNFSSKGAEGCIQCPPGMLDQKGVTTENDTSLAVDGYYPRINKNSVAFITSIWFL